MFEQWTHFFIFAYKGFNSKRLLNGLLKEQDFPVFLREAIAANGGHDWQYLFVSAPIISSQHLDFIVDFSIIISFFFF